MLVAPKPLSHGYVYPLPPAVLGGLVLNGFIQIRMSFADHGASA